MSPFDAAPTILVAEFHFFFLLLLIFVIALFHFVLAPFASIIYGFDPWVCLSVSLLTKTRRKKKRESKKFRLDIFFFYVLRGMDLTVTVFRIILYKVDEFRFHCWTSDADHDGVISPISIARIHFSCFSRPSAHLSVYIHSNGPAHTLFYILALDCGRRCNAEQHGGCLFCVHFYTVIPPPFLPSVYMYTPP